MIEQLREKLKKKGITHKTFFDQYIKEQTEIGYPGFMSQLNGYTKQGLSETVRIEIEKYLNEK